MPTTIDQLAHPGQGTRLTHGDYQQIWREQGATSLPDLPEDPVFRRFSSTAAIFAAGAVYPVWWTDPEGERFVSHRHQNRQPITFQELMEHEPLCREILERRQLHGRGQRAHSLVICEHCQSHGVTVVKDGCKELLSVLWQGKSLHPLIVVQVSGRDWSGSWGDMGFILHWRQEHSLRTQEKLKEGWR
ncbi:MAG: hypothetical protein FDX18_09110 [Chlorobium sp.]|nr:MAG: hypothetical protein FDX18_09110 [Chlorobium sp.]